MAGRLLLWLVLAVAAWWLLKPRRASAPRHGTSVQPDATARALEAMVDCAGCGLHFPASEAVRDGVRIYCCTAHRDAGARRGE